MSAGTSGAANPYPMRVTSKLRVRVFAEDPSWEERIAQSLDLPPCSVHEVEGGVILPLEPADDGYHDWVGGVVDPKGTFVAGHVYHAGTRRTRNIIAGYSLPPQVRRKAGVALYAGGPADHHFGHFVTEAISRLWWVVDNPDVDVWVVVNTRELTALNIDILKALGVEEDRIISLAEPTQFDYVIIPEQALHLGSGESNPEALRKIYDAIRSWAPEGSSERVYLTRTALENRSRSREVNEVFLEDFYRSQGFEIVSPEQLPFRDQVAMLSGAKELASTAGTLSHLVLFSPNGVHQHVALRHPTSLGLAGQWAMSRARASTIDVVDTTLPILPSSRWAGVAFHTTTPSWVQYAADVFGVSMEASRPEDYFADLFREWVDVVLSASDRDLRFFPRWTAADFLESFSKHLAGRQFTAEEKARLLRHFAQDPEA